MKKVLDLIQVLDNLSRIPRTGGVLFAGIDPSRSDSVAEHHYKVTYLSLIFGELALENSVQIDLTKLLKAAITHDWAESILLDVPSGSPSYASYFGDEGVFRKLIKSGEEEAKRKMEKYVNSEYKLNLEIELTEVEDSILKIADTVAFLIEILEWKYQGMKYSWFDYLWSNTINNLKNRVHKDLHFLNSIVEDLDEAYKIGIKPVNPFLTKEKYQTLKNNE